MWLFTTIGFFSVVQKHGENHLTIRARASGDLDLLRDQFMPSLSPTLSKAGTDYPYRATISKAEFALGLSKLGSAIDYHNFKDEVASKMGKNRANTYSKVWSTLLELEGEQPEKALAKEGYAYGGVIFNANGLVLLREPKNHFDGYVWTFPKGKPNSNETEEQTALREVEEETGIVAKIVKRIPGEFQGGTSKNVYFLMAVEKDTGKFQDETVSVIWVDRAEAEKRIRMTTNPVGRERDLQVLKAAFASMA